MNRHKKQATLLQAWNNSPTLTKTPAPFRAIEIDLTDEVTEEDLLFSKALDISLAEYEAAQASTSMAQRNNRTSNAIETLPGFDIEAGETWIYPTNYPIRKYQFSIAEQALFKNTIVILPTGLGKTFIAAVVMYNFFRWYPRGKIIFMAPTKPLVAQQIEACFNIMGIPLSASAEMTGAMQPEARKKTWRDKRVFFITPQVMNNDLARGICPAADVKLLVFDEAHKATKNYAYCQVVNEVVKYSQQFRVLALSATPGSDMTIVKQVFQNLLISHVELRTEDSADIQPYTFSRSVETILVPMTEDIKRVIDNVLSVLTVYIERLKRHHVFYCHNVASIKTYHLIKSREQFRLNLNKKMSKELTASIEGNFSLAITICHAYDMLLIYGLRSFYNFIQEHFDGLKGYARSRSELLRNVTLIDVMNDLRSKLEKEKYEELDGFVSHPKLLLIEQLIKDHFTNFEKDKNDQSSTRVMVFSAYRSSVDEITIVLNKSRPLIRAMSFTGQASSSTSKGITQKEQIEIVHQFRSGGYNTLVSTCVGEEGLDIGDVDLIICFDVYKSPIRLVQRMGRTGRKRKGKVIMLTSEGREEQSYDKSKATAASIHKSISKENFQSLYAQNPRMVPKGLNPRCHKMHITVSAYQPKLVRKKMKSVEAADESILKFLSRHNHKNSALENEIDYGETNEEVKITSANLKKRKETKNDLNQKPSRINKKQKKALILDDSDDEVHMTNQFEIKNYTEPGNRCEAIDEMELDKSDCHKENDEVTLSDSSTIDLNQDESNENIISFFPEISMKDNLNVTGTKNAIRSPPSFSCVFSSNKEELSPIDYEQILEDKEIGENIELPFSQYKNKTISSTKCVESDFDDIETNYSPIKSSIGFDEPVSPIISSVVRQPDHWKDDELDSLSSVLKKSATYSVTQLIDMVYEDSIKINEEEREEAEEEILNYKFTKLGRKAGDVPESKISSQESQTKTVPNFDLKFNLSFDDTISGDDVIPSSQNENNPIKETASIVTFDLNIQEFFNDSVDEIESSVKQDKETEKNLPTRVTSTPKVTKLKSTDGNNDLSFDWDNLPHVKCVTFQPNEPKKTRKRSLSRKFIQSQAVVTDNKASEDESETELDIVESSFIDDDPRAVENSMTAVYLKSIKDNVGPKKFKIDPPKENNDVDMTQFTQDDYQEDSFCVSNDITEFEDTSKIANKGKSKWKRIVNKVDTSSSPEVTITSKPSANDVLKTDEDCLILVDSKEVNGSHQLISELRHQHKILTHVVSLNNCDYIVSTRMGVERKLVSGISNIQLKNKLVERINAMAFLFDRTCLVIEADREKLGVKKNSASVYYNRLISALLQLPIKILYTDSQADTAKILKELALDEKKKGFGLLNYYTSPLTKKEQQLCRLYQKIPVVNYVTAVNLCKNTLSVQQLVNSSSTVIQRKGNVNESRANDIVNFVKQNFNSL